MLEWRQVLRARVLVLAVVPARVLGLVAETWHTIDRPEPVVEVLPALAASVLALVSRALVAVADVHARVPIPAVVGTRSLFDTWLHHLVLFSVALVLFSLPLALF